MPVQHQHCLTLLILSLNILCTVHVMFHVWCCLAMFELFLRCIWQPSMPNGPFALLCAAAAGLQQRNTPI
jgi:hypothetical protein